MRELIDRRRGGWGRHHRRKLSEPHHGFAQIAFPAESGRKRIPSGLPGCGRRNIGGSCEKRRIQLASSPLRVFQGCGWVRTVSFQWYVLDYRRSGKWFISVPETAENRGPREEGKICNLVPRVVENKSPNYRSNCDRIEARTKIDSRHDELMLFQGLDNVSSATLRPFNSDINTPRIDSYRFSMANLEGELSFFFFFYKPCTGHVMDTTSIVQFPYPSLCLLPKEKKKKKKKSQSSLSPHFVHPRCSRFYIRFVSPVCRTVFLHPPPFCASWINEQRGQKGRFIPPPEIVACFSSGRGNEGNEDLIPSLSLWLNRIANVSRCCSTHCRDVKSSRR